MDIDFASKSAKVSLRRSRHGAIRRSNIAVRILTSVAVSMMPANKPKSPALTLCFVFDELMTPTAIAVLHVVVVPACHLTRAERDRLSAGVDAIGTQ